MTEREMLEAIINDMQAMKSDMQAMKSDMQTMKSDMQVMKSDMQVMKERTESIEQRVNEVEISLENVTNHNIQLLAENHMTLIDKLNQAIKVQDKSILYEVQLSGLKARIDVLEKEIAGIKAKIA